MKKDREQLEVNLRTLIDQIKHKRKSTEYINNFLKEYNIPVGTFNSIAANNMSIGSLSIPTLCLLTLAVYKQTEDNSVSVHEYFTEKEIELAMKYQGEDNEKLQLPITLSDVTMIDLENYVTKIKMVYLVEMFHSQLIIYDYETQRSAKYRKLKDDVIPVPDINRKSVLDISEHMINETYLSDMITLNVYSDEVEPLYYDEKAKKLTINDGASISILDGFHRLQGGVRAVAINPNLDLEMILSIRSYDQETAKKYFGQINTINVVKPERLRELKSERYSDIVVRDLQIKSDLKGKIASAPRIAEIAGQLTTFDILSYSIDNIFNPKTTIQAREVSDYLVDFFNYLVGSYVDEFMHNPGEYKKTYINHPLVFAGYVRLAKTMQEKNMNLREIKDVVAKIDFQDEKLIEILDDKKGINNKRNRSRLIDYFMIKGENIV